MGLARIALGITWLAFVAFGVAYVVSPVAMAALTHVDASSNLAATDVRAVYGGLQLGVAVVIHPLSKRREHVSWQLAAAAAICLAVAACRLLGIVLDDSFDRVHATGLIFEIPLGTLCLAARWRLMKLSTLAAD